MIENKVIYAAHDAYTDASINLVEDKYGIYLSITLNGYQWTKISLTKELALLLKRCPFRKAANLLALDSRPIGQRRRAQEEKTRKRD